MEKVLNISYKLITLILLVFVAVDCHVNEMKYSSFYTIYEEAIQTLVASIKMKTLLIFPSLAELDIEQIYLKLFFIEFNEVMQMALGGILSSIQIFEIFWNADHTLDCIVSNLLWCTFLLTSILQDYLDVDPLIMSLIKLCALISTIMVNNNNGCFTSQYDLLRAKPKYNSTVSVNLNMSSKKYQNMEDTDSDIRKSSAPKKKTAKNNPAVVLRNFTASSNSVLNPAPLNSSLPINIRCVVLIRGWQLANGGRLNIAHPVLESLFPATLSVRPIPKF